VDRPRTTVTAPAADLRERRAAERVQAALGAAYEDSQRQVFLRTRDLSARGIFLFSPDPPPVGVEAHLLLELPGETAFLRLSGRVTRREVGEHSGFALQFGSPTTEIALRALRSYVAGLAREGAPRS
jgi:hypothetical protein